MRSSIRRWSGPSVHTSICLRGRATGENDGFLKADFVHRAHPAMHIGVGRSIVVRMRVDHGMARLLDARFGNFEDRTRLVILEQDFVRRRLRGGNRGEDKNSGEPTEGSVEHGLFHTAGLYV